MVQGVYLLISVGCYIKAFHQSLIDDGYPTIDTKRFVMNQVPRIMAELERLKGENKRLVEENEELKNGDG